MAVTVVGRLRTDESGASVQVHPRDESFNWWPQAGQVLLLIARYPVGVTAVGPPGWACAAHQDRVLWTGREGAVSLWWLQLTKDYDGWFWGTGTWLSQFELPTVHFSSACAAELDFAAL